MNRAIFLIAGLLCVYTMAYTQNTNPWPSTGSVGIGTTSPQSQLHVYSTSQYPRYYVQSTHASGAPGYTITETNGNEGWTWHYNIAGGFMGFHRGGFGNVLAMTNGGYVGIGTTTPRSKVETIGDMRLSASSTSSSFILDGIGLNTGNNYSNVRLIASSANGSGYLQTRLDNWGGAFTWVRASATGDVTVMAIDATSGNVGIGTTTPQARLAVNGDIFSKKIKVTQTGWPDYVFHPSYLLRPLSEVEKFIQQHKHLPEVPSAAAIEKDGLDLGDNQAVLLKKIEELTLYVIEQDKKQKEQHRIIQLLQKEIRELKKQK